MSQTPSRPALSIPKPVEISPDAGDPTGVFLSPRVIDQQAFEDFAARLRTMVGEATDATTSVESALSELRTLRQEGTASVTRQKALIEAGAKLVKAVEAKQSSLEAVGAGADALIERIAQSAARAERASETLDERLERVVTQRLEALEARMDERVRTLTNEIESKLQTRVTEMSTTLRSIDATRDGLESLIRDATENTLAALHDANERGARIAGWDPADIVGGTGLGQPNRDSLADLILRAEGLQQQTLDATERLTKLRDESKRLVSDMPKALDTTRQALGLLDTERVDLEKRLMDAARQSEHLTASTQPIVELRERAEQTASTLTDLIERSETIREKEQSAEQRLREAISGAQRTLESLEPWREVCFMAPQDAERAGLPPVLESITRKFQEGLARDISAMATALQEVASRPSDVTPR